MHGLDIIVSLNDEAARREHFRKARELAALGKTVVYKIDSRRLMDIDEPLRSFDTVVAAGQWLKGKGVKYCCL